MPTGEEGKKDSVEDLKVIFEEALRSIEEWGSDSPFSGDTPEDREKAIQDYRKQFGKEINNSGGSFKDKEELRGKLKKVLDEAKKRVQNSE